MKNVFKSDKELLQICINAHPKWANNITDKNYVTQGTMLSEMFFMCALAEHVNVDIMIDSGTHLGRSAAIFNQYGFLTHTIDCEIDPATIAELNCNSISYEIGNDKELIENMLKKFPNANIGIFMDSTKGRSACRMLQYFTSKYKNIKFVAIHDQWKNHYMHRFWPQTIYSDNQAFYDKWWMLNTQEELKQIKARYGNPDNAAKYIPNFDTAFKGFVAGVAI